MARIVIAAYGSRGDLLPLTDIACRLCDVGHDVVMTATPDLVADITALGLQVRPVDVHLEDTGGPLPENPVKAAMQLVRPKGMHKLGKSLLAALDDIPADLVMLSPFAEVAGHSFAESRGIPGIGLRMQPISATADFPPSLIGD